MLSFEFVPPVPLADFPISFTELDGELAIIPQKPFGNHKVVISEISQNEYDDMMDRYPLVPGRNK